jgi:glycosyltransferase involved in cell wall biosynthesis
MISIVVCTYNGKSRIEPCLVSLISQVNAPEYELLVVDNASTDQTENFIRDYLDSGFPQGDWKLLHESKAGLLHARIRGLNEAKFDWVLFCDDDNVLFPDFLVQCQKVLSKNSSIGVLGSQGIPDFSGSKPEWFDRYASSYAVGPQPGSNPRAGLLAYVYGACSVYRKKPLLDLFHKGFKPVLSGRKEGEMSSGDDVEWCALMQLLGFSIAYSEKMKFHHQLPASRLTWEYYLLLKQGISGSAGLLFSYQFYFGNKIRSSSIFKIKYWKSLTSSWLLFQKYRIRWNGNPQSPEDQLAYTILEARMKAFSNQRNRALSHFNQLEKYFGA